MGEISEYASLDAAAFQNAECDPVYFEQPVECVIRRAKAGESLDGYYDGRGSLSDSLANQWKVWEITCKLCGLSVPFDILETKSPEYDENKNAKEHNRANRHVTRLRWQVMNGLRVRHSSASVEDFSCVA